MKILQHEFTEIVVPDPDSPGVFGGFLRFGAGLNPLDIASRISAEAIKQGLRYGAVQEIFQTTLGAIIQREQYENKLKEQQNKK